MAENVSEDAQSDKGRDQPESADWLAGFVRALGDWAKIAAPVAALGGFVLVALAKTGMDWFYSNFKLTPGEVGLDQTSILFQTAATAIGVLSASLIIGLGVSIVFARATWRRIRKETTRSYSVRALIGEPIIVKRGAVVALALLAGYFLWGVGTAHQSVNRIRSGESTSSQIFAHGEIIAWCVEVWWKDPRWNEVFGSPPGLSLVYFGQASGIAAFYDARTGHTIRIPTSDVATRSC